MGPRKSHPTECTRADLTGENLSPCTFPTWEGTGSDLKTVSGSRVPALCAEAWSRDGDLVGGVRNR